MTALTATPPLKFSDLDTIVLRMGDNDSKQIWGGKKHHGQTGTAVIELQAALIAVGTLLDKTPDGDFGHHTRDALQRFQWYVRKQSYRLKVAPGQNPASGVISPYSGTVAGAPGLCDKKMAAELLAWQAANFVTTTPLVRVNLQNVSNVDTSDTFKTLDYPQATAGEVLAHADFADNITSAMNDEAKKAKVMLNINQTFRVEGASVGSAVVTPAKKSQHLIGHAVDLNIVDGDNVNTAAMFNAGKETDGADKFITGIKARGLRWGGDFSDTDPVHFDDLVDPKGEDYKMNLFFVQHCYQENHPMRVVG